MYATPFDRYLERKRVEYGEKFDPSELDPRFMHYYGTATRLKVDDYGQIEHGTVGVTTGWRPVFILVHRRTDYGSSTTLTGKTKILGIKPRGARSYALYRDPH